MDLSKRDILILQKVLDDSTFELLQRVASEMLSKLAVGTMIKETAFLTAKEAIQREERKRTLQKFFENLEQLAGRSEVS